MNGYTKLFNSIITSTIWTEDDKTRLVWITMLALADKNAGLELQIETLAAEKASLEAELKAANDAVARLSVKVNKLEGPTTKNE